jgi:hypothetical protein
MADLTDRSPADDAPDASLDAFARRIAAPIRAHTASAPDRGFTSAVLAAVAADAAGTAEHDGTRHAARHTEDGDIVTQQAVRPTALQRSRSRWWTRRWQLEVTPVRLLTAAASLFLTVVLARSWSGAPTAGGGADTTATALVMSDSVVQVVRFELRAPASARVSLVGAFNGWDAGTTPLVPVTGTPDRDGLVPFVVTIPLHPGQHEYAFVLDDGTWIADPKASTVVDEFGTRTSRVIVEGARLNGA